MIEDFKNYLKLNDMVEDRYANVVKYLEFCNIKGLDIFNITFEGYQNFLLDVKTKRKLQNRSMNRVLTDIRLFYKFLLTSGKVKEDVVEIIKKFKLLPEVHKQKSYLTKEELSELIVMGETFCVHMDILKLKALLYFMFYTGLRKGEILNLKRADIDLEKRTILVRIPTKNRLERIVPFPKTIEKTKYNKSIDFVKMLKDYFASEGEGKNAFNMTDMKFQFLFDDIKTFSPEKRISAHTLRHSFARMLAKNMIDSRIAQKLLGHKDIATTMIYYDPDIDIIQDIYNEKVK